MGIDIYMHWRGQTDKDHAAQITGFSVTAGGAGYLREAYHGGPYVTRFLVQEAFEVDPPKHDDQWRGPQIPAKVLRQRLPAAVVMALYRDVTVYGGDDKPGVIDGSSSPPHATDGPATTPPNPDGSAPSEEEVKGIIDDPVVRQKLRDVFAGIELMRGGGDEKVFAQSIPPALIPMVEQRILDRALPDFALSYVDFVRLAERKEHELGEPVRVYASY